MGEWLREHRLKQGHRLKDVSDAIGRGIQYVCDVEHGRRGHRMEPVTAMLWCEYLELDPATMFSYLQLGSGELERQRIQHYLETGTWARKFVAGKRALDDVAPLVDDLIAGMSPGLKKNQLYQIRDAIETARGALRVPRKRKQGKQR